MKKENIKRVFLKALIIGGLTFGVFNSMPMNVKAYSYQTIDRRTLSEDQLNYIEKYSQIFNINSDFVLECLDEHRTSRLDFTEIDGVKYDSEEEAILTFIYRLAHKPDKLGYTKKEIKFEDSGYEMTISPEEMIYYYSDLLDIDPEIALSISYAECGTEMDSHNYLSNNNPAGIGPYKKFNNKEEGIIYYTFLLKHGYKLADEADKEFFNCIANTYCPDDPSHWISLANGIYNNVDKDYLFYNQELKDEYTDSDYINDDNYQIIEKLNDEEENKNTNTQAKSLQKIKSTII